MVCETKIVAAEDHEALPGAKKDALLAAAGAMWPPLPAAPPPGPQSLGGAGGAGPPGGRGLCIREFRAAEQEAARRIFYDGIMERIPNTAFRGLRQHPRTQLLYVLLAGQCAGTCRRPRLPGLCGDTRRTLSAPLAPPRASPGGKRPLRPLARARTRTRAPPAFCGGRGAVASSGGVCWGRGCGQGKAGVSTCVPASPSPSGHPGGGG